MDSLYLPVVDYHSPVSICAILAAIKNAVAIGLPSMSKGEIELSAT